VADPFGFGSQMVLPDFPVKAASGVKAPILPAVNDD
jgi:hypothetical protein